MRFEVFVSIAVCAMRHIAVLFVLSSLHLSASAAEVPDFIGQGEPAALQSELPIGTMEFVAALDDPPFSFVDDNSKLNGFSVFLARAVCEELQVNSCIISGKMTKQLDLTSTADGSAIVISRAQAMPAARLNYFFSRPYLKIPARLVGRKSDKNQPSFAAGLSGLRLGVIANSPFERMARAFFPDAKTVGYADSTPLFSELESGKIDFVFGDGLELANRIFADGGSVCCKFAGAPYYSSHFLGEGVRFAIPVAKGATLAQIDDALVALQQKGKVEELFLRFFPLSFY